MRALASHNGNGVRAPLSSMSYVSRVVCWFSPVLRKFFTGYSGFFSLHNNQRLNSNSILDSGLHYAKLDVPG